MIDSVKLVGMGIGFALYINAISHVALECEGDGIGDDELCKQIEESIGEADVAANIEWKEMTDEQKDTARKNIIQRHSNVQVQ